MFRLGGGEIDGEGENGRVCEQARIGEKRIEEKMSRRTI
jgi:hypothetical protein